MDPNAPAPKEEMTNEIPNFSFQPADPEWPQTISDHSPFYGEELPHPSSIPYHVPVPSQPTASFSSISSPSQTSAHEKVAIPRLTPAHPDTSRKRSTWACQNCRERKMKCSGDHPTCKQCEAVDASCVYQDAKRVRDRKKLEALSNTVDRYETLLHEIESIVDQDTKRKIKKAVDGMASGSSNDEAMSSDSSVGSYRDLDIVQEDISRNDSSVAAGYFGKGSEVSWMQRLEDTLKAEIGQTNSHKRRRMSTSRDEHNLSQSDIKEFNYHLDDQEVPLDDSVDPYALPPREAADQYYQAYLKVLHPSFMVIREPTFTAQYKSMYDHRSRPPARWLGVLNMIFALGARYCQASEDTEISEGTIFMNRARKLCLTGDVLFQHADLQQIQVTILAALYLIEVGHVNRASRMSHVALESAIILGLNLRWVDRTTAQFSKETRSRLWWSILCVEYLVTATTGRMSGTNESLTAVGLPNPLYESRATNPEMDASLKERSIHTSHFTPSIFQSDQQKKEAIELIRTCEPTTSLVFHFMVDLMTTNQSFLTKVYSIEGLRQTASEIRRRTRSYSEFLETWLLKLPDSYKFIGPNNAVDDKYGPDPFMRERVCLAINYYSAQISLCRPCLSATKKPTSKSKTTFRQERITRCLSSACSLIGVLPKQPDLEWLASYAPRWSIVHFLMQAVTALLLGLACSPDDESTAVDIGKIATHIQVAMLWLQELGSVNAAAHRAFSLCDNCLHRIMPGLDFGSPPVTT
ncbi:fungal-specific transcription factor domain-containing protein [Penicillium angulare]|uniref:Fungal-specific transcription factor domain-containing protein n=1 Tax=Penicillium angulare TaxID=116970 RepID=A0A9W9G6W6_9EURO|nr:fungal-specific transcription factor domain-containing protein [Penicillium angulare]